MNRKERRAAKARNKSDIPDMIPREQRVSDDTKLSVGLPPSVGVMLRDMTGRLRDKDPAHQYMTMLAFVQTLGAGMAAAGDSGEGQFIASCVMASYIEIAELDESHCNNDFTAALYRLSAKANHCAAAEKYIRAGGGWKALCGRMNEYLEEHPEIIKEGTQGIAMLGKEIEPTGPQTAASILAQYTNEAREMLERDGEIEAVVFCLDVDGSGVGIVAGPGQSGDKRFFAMASDAARAQRPGNPFLVQVYEIWIGEQGSTTRPSKQEGRKEAIVVRVFDDTDKSLISNVLDIERDWQTGKAKIGEIDSANWIAPVNWENETPAK